MNRMCLSRETPKMAMIVTKYVVKDWTGGGRGAKLCTIFCYFVFFPHIFILFILFRFMRFSGKGLQI